MGDLEPYMDEQFVQQALAAVGETVVSVRLIRQKGTNVPAGYCFIEFSSEQQATTALSRLSGIPIPGTQPMKRFRLNWANSGAVGGVAAPPGAPEFSIFVGDLTPDVTDYQLHDFFARRYTSVRGAKVIIDTSGHSKGYGFVRFSSEDEMKNALVQMQGVTGCGSKALRLSPSNRSSTATPSGRTVTAQPVNPIEKYQQALEQHKQMVECMQHYQQYQQSLIMASWQAYQQQQQKIFQDEVVKKKGNGRDEGVANDPHAVIDPCAPVDVDSMNKETMAAYYVSLVIIKYTTNNYINVNNMMYLFIY
jgi:RNA recognition motif-containing protein